LPLPEWKKHCKNKGVVSIKKRESSVTVEGKGTEKGHHPFERTCSSKKGRGRGPRKKEVGAGDTSLDTTKGNPGGDRTTEKRTVRRGAPPLRSKGRKKKVPPYWKGGRNGGKERGRNQKEKSFLLGRHSRNRKAPTSRGGRPESPPTKKNPEKPPSKKTKGREGFPPNH